jgi:hypothetical protein
MLPGDRSLPIFHAVVVPTLFALDSWNKVYSGIGANCPAFHPATAHNRCIISAAREDFDSVQL